MAYYFAYGTNMNKDRMKERGIKSTRRFAGTLPGYKLVFQEFSTVSTSYSNIIPSKKGEVEGIVYEVNETARNLDLYLHLGVNYLKEKRIISTEEGDIECIVYIGNPEVVGDKKKPKKKFLDHLLEGKKYLSKEYYKKLEKILD